MKNNEIKYDNGCGRSPKLFARRYHCGRMECYACQLYCGMKIDEELEEKRKMKPKGQAAVSKTDGTPE